MFIQSGTNQIELPARAQGLADQILELRCHEMVNESVLPFTGSLVSTPRTIYWYFWGGSYAKE